MRILLLENEHSFAHSVRSYLYSRGHFVDYYDNGDDVFLAVKMRSYDFYILNTDVPLKDGFECLRFIHTIYPTAPILMVSSNHDPELVVRSFNEGSNDYVKKPFHLSELEVRMKYIVSISEKIHGEQISPIVSLSDNYIFDKDTGFLYFDGAPQSFSRRESALLRLFISNIDSIVTEDSIRAHVWQGNFVENSTVRSLVKRVQNRLKGDFIENIWGVGYVLRRQLQND